MDQFSGYSFVYLQQRIMSEETVQAKHTFERVAEQRGVKILHYHVDNGRFTDNAFIADCNAQRQSLSYCGVNAHFQNGIAERRIRDLQEQTRTSMLYAMNKRKKMVLICLWPYAMRHANDVANATPRKGQDDSPVEKFTGVPVRPKLRHFHAFGCPAYVLDNALQSGQGVPKWKQRARLGIYLGPSPSHARTVALILNPHTGHVSPQFHVKFDDFFETVGNSSTDMDSLEPEWKYLSSFASKKGAADKGDKGMLTNLLTPRRGTTTVTYDADPPPRILDDSPTTQLLNELTMETIMIRMNTSLRYRLTKQHHRRRMSNSKTPGHPRQRPDRREAGGRYATLQDTSKASPKEIKASWHGMYCLTKMSKNKCRRRPCSTRYKRRLRTLSPSLPQTIPTFSTGIRP